MKILFLDVDGVLNCAKYFNTRETPRDLSPREIDPWRVALLHRIIEATGAKVVVSSSWRLHPDGLAEVRKAVDPHYLDKTIRLERHEDRHAEIAEWLSSSMQPGMDPIRYAILDDDTCAGIGHGDNFFRTYWYGNGLDEGVAEAVIAHLNT